MRWVPVHVPEARERRAWLGLPASGRVRGLAVELHGSGMDAERQRAISRLDARLPAQGVAVLLPQAAIAFQLMAGLEAGFAWNVPGVPLPGTADAAPDAPDDLAWIERLVGSVRTRLGREDVPLFLAGYSGGARLASHLLARGGVEWSGAGLVAGLRAVEGGRPPPPTLAFHGVDDPVNPYAGGRGPRWDEGVEAATHLYARAQGCDEAFQDEARPGARRRSYRGPGGAALTLYTVAHAAHAWPGAADPHHLQAFGPAGAGVDASRLIADHFTVLADAARPPLDRAAGETRPHPALEPSA